MTPRDGDGPAPGRRARPPRYPRIARSLALAVLVVPTAVGAQEPVPAESPDSAPAEPVDPLVPDTVIPAGTRPALLILRAPERPTVTLRLSVPLTETAIEAGAGRLIVDLGLDRARSMAGPVSARIDGTRTPEGIAWSVTGALEDLDYLTFLLRVATAEPRVGRIDFQRARAELLEEVRRASETPSGLVGRRLRERAFPSTPPIAGTVGSLEAMSPGVLRDLWLRSHDPSRMTLLVVGDVPRELLYLSVDGFGAPADASAPDAPEQAPPTRGADPEVLRRWFGEARVLPDPWDPRGRVAAILVADHMRRVATSFEAHVELWQAGGQRALAVMGAAYSRAAGTMRGRVRDALTEASEELTEAEVAAAVARLRREVLFGARTPWGRAEVVGRHLEGTGGRGFRPWIDALDAVTLDSMKAYLTELASLTPVRTEVSP